MFDVGFVELLLVAVIGLLVLGPEKLPGAIRTAALWLGRLRRSLNEVKRDISREIGADEIRQQLHNESILQGLEKDKERLLELDRELQEGQGRDESLRATSESVSDGHGAVNTVDNPTGLERKQNDS